jgi:L-lactate dehydrogenase complex protein LldE
MRVNLFVTCLADTFFPGIPEATERVLEKLGHEMHCPLDQTCCGQPMFNAGYFEEARSLARAFVRVFRKTEGPIVAPSSSCAAMVRVHYPRLFQDHPAELEAAEEVGRRTFELTEFLVRHLQVNLADHGARFEDSVTFHRSCHFRALGIEHEPEALINQIAGLRYVPLPDIDRCCGFGGTFSLAFPHVSRSMAAEKLACIQKTGARWLVFADSGCAMNLAGYARRVGAKLETLHIAQLIDRALGENP